MKLPELDLLQETWSFSCLVSVSVFALFRLHPIVTDVEFCRVVLIMVLWKEMGSAGKENLLEFRMF